MSDADLAPPDLRCPITWDYLDDPVTLPCCGRSFSRQPLRSIFEEQDDPRCPMCQAPSEVSQVDALPRSISLSYLVEDARRRGSVLPAETRPTQGTEGIYTAILKKITNHLRPLGLLTIDSKTGRNRTLLIPVADRSGSMGGAPTEQVQYSLQRVVDLTFQNRHLVTSIIHYDDSASTLNILPDSFNADHYKEKIRNINARGGTYFRTAFAEIIRSIEQNKQDPLISSVCVVFLTDGQDSCADRTSLVEELRTGVQRVWQGSFTLHAVGFSHHHDFPFLDALRKVGTTEGAYRFADPSEDLDSLSNKINSVLDVVATSVVNPIRLDRLPEGVSLLAGSNGKYWVTGDMNGLDMVTISTDEIEAPLEVAVGQDPVENDESIVAAWHTHLLDEMSAELIPLSTQASGLDRDLHLQLIERRLRAVQARLGINDEKNRSRVESIRAALDTLMSSGEISMQKLQDLRYEGTFATQRGERPPPRAISAGTQPIATATVVGRKTKNAGSWQTIPLLSKRREKGDKAALWSVLGSGKTAEVLAYIRDNAHVLQESDARGRNAIMMAASIGRLPVVEYLCALVRDSFPINRTDKEGNTACDLAVLYGYNRSAEALLDGGGVCKRAGDMLLRTCVEKKYFRTASLLLKKEIAKVTDDMVDAVPTNEGFVWLNERQGTGITLERAISKGLLDAVEEKIGSLGDFSVSWEPYRAVFTNPTPDHWRIVDALLRGGKARAHEVLRDGGDTTTPLFLASEKGCLKLVQILTANDPDVQKNLNWTNHKGTTALWIAACNRHIDVTEHLLNLGADPNIPNHAGDGPLIPACQKGNGMIVELLVNCGARLEVHNPERDNPVLICCRHNQHSILETLLQACTYVERQGWLERYADIDGFPPLHAATELGHFACLPVLHNFGADLEWRTAENNKILPGATALHLACHYGRAQAFQVLLSLGADVTSKTTVGAFTVLHIAVRQGHRALIREILAHDVGKVLLSSPDAEGRLPKYYASAELTEEFFVDRFSRSLARVLSTDDSTMAKCSMVLRKHARSLGCFEFSDVTKVRFEDNSDMLSWAHLLGKKSLVLTLEALGADGDAADDLGITARFWKEYFRPGIGGDVPDTVRAMLQRVDEAKKASLQNRAVLSVKPGAESRLLEGSDQEDALMERMCAGYDVACDVIAKPDHGPVTLLGFLAKLEKSKELPAAESILWDAKVNALKRVAAGLSGPLSPIHIIALYLYTSNTDVFRLVNDALHGTRLGATMWPPFVQCLHQALHILPPWGGEAYRAVGTTFDPDVYRKGATVTWDGFSVCTQEWRRVSPQFDRRTGVVFIIRSNSGREVHPYSRNAADREVIFLPGTTFVVEDYYKPNVLCLGQANIRGTTFAVTDKDLTNAARGVASIVIQICEQRPPVPSETLRIIA